MTAPFGAVLPTVFAAVMSGAGYVLYRGTRFVVSRVRAVG